MSKFCHWHPCPSSMSLVPANRFFVLDFFLIFIVAFGDLDAIELQPLRGRRRFLLCFLCSSVPRLTVGGRCARVDHKSCYRRSFIFVWFNSSTPFSWSLPFEWKCSFLVHEEFWPCNLTVFCIKCFALPFWIVHTTVSLTFLFLSLGVRCQMVDANESMTFYDYPCKPKSACASQMQLHRCMRKQHNVTWHGSCSGVGVIDNDGGEERDSIFFLVCSWEISNFWRVKEYGRRKRISPLRPL